VLHFASVSFIGLDFGLPDAEFPIDCGFGGEPVLELACDVERGPGSSPYALAAIVELPSRPII
jgi:hypothetical protein